MSNMNITSAQYQSRNNNNQDSIKAVIDGVELWVPINPANRHYAEIMRQVNEGSLTIAEAD